MFKNNLEAIDMESADRVALTPETTSSTIYMERVP